MGFTWGIPGYMTQVRSGGCLCGAVRYRLEGEPNTTFTCHCTVCQKRTGSAFGIGMLVPAENLNVEQGSTRTVKRIADSGSEIETYFCGDCGTSLYAVNSQRRHANIVFAGSLDDPSSIKIELNTWTDSALPWVDLSNAKCFPRSPDFSKSPPPDPEQASR